MSDNIIQEIRSGNKEAVKTVYQDYAKDVYNFAKSITGDHDSALAATKKTFLKLFKNIQSGEDPVNLRTAALKIAYDEAYKISGKTAEAPAAEEAPAQEAAAETAEAPAAQEPVYAEPMFQKRDRRPAVEEDFEEEPPAYIEEEEDDFVPPERPVQEEPEGVYIPKGGYDTLKLDPVEISAEEERVRRRRRPEPEDVYEDEYEEDYEEPVRRPGRAPAAEDLPPAKRQRRRPEEVDVYAIDADGNETDDYYDDYEEEERKPKNRGLFIFCIILNIILILILLWFLAGLLVNLGILPEIDLGYSWFNSHIYPLF